MQILHNNGFDETENQNYLRILRSNFFTGMKELLASLEKSGLSVTKENKKAASFFLDYSNTDDLVTEESLQQAKELWADEAVQKTWEVRDSLPNFTIINFDYILKNMDRLSANDAEVNHDDILRCRQRTTGLSELNFPFEKNYFHIFDVGGQKPERRKWDVIAQKHNPTAVLYFASLIDFDIPLLADPDKNLSRMDESLEVWKALLKKECFATTTFILLLNKSDLFEDKVQRIDMSKTFENYTGGNDYEKACEFIKQKYIRIAKKSLHSEKKSTSLLYLCY